MLSTCAFTPAAAALAVKRQTQGGKVHSPDLSGYFSTWWAETHHPGQTVAEGMTT